MSQKKVFKNNSFCIQLSDTCIAFQPYRSQTWLVWIFDQGKTDMGRLHSLLLPVLWLFQSHSHRNSSRAFIFLILFALTFAAKCCWGKKLWIPGLIFLSCCNEQERNAADFYLFFLKKNLTCQALLLDPIFQNCLQERLTGFLGTKSLSWEKGWQMASSGKGIFDQCLPLHSVATSRERDGGAGGTFKENRTRSTLRMYELSNIHIWLSSLAALFISVHFSPLFPTIAATCKKFCRHA